MFQNLNNVELGVVNRTNDIFESVKSMEDRVDLNKTVAYLAYKRLTSMEIIKPNMSEPERLSKITSAVDTVRELIHIDGDIFKSGLIEVDRIINNTDFNKVLDGELSLYPTLPIKYLGNIKTLGYFVCQTFKKGEVNND